MDRTEGIQVFQARKPGPRVGIMAICHGNEGVGLKALEYLNGYFQTNSLAKGSLFLIQGNPRAYEQKKLCVDHNLNRLFLETKDIPSCIDRQSYEYQRSLVLKPILKNLDFFLDLHATNKPSPVFSLSRDPHDGPSTKLGSILPVDFYSYGWKEKITGTTIDWVIKYDGVGVTIECGDTKSYQEGERVAILASQRFLQYTGLQDFGCSLQAVKRYLVVTHLEMVQHKESFCYLNDYKNFQPLKMGEVIAKDACKTYRVEGHNQVIIFPTNQDYIRSGAIKEAYLLGEFYE